MHVALEPDVCVHFLENHATDAAGFRVPFDNVTALEGFAHTVHGSARRVSTLFTRVYDVFWRETR
jgi:hypothetical protein